MWLSKSINDQCQQSEIFLKNFLEFCYLYVIYVICYLLVLLFICSTITYSGNGGPPPDSGRASEKNEL